MPIYCLHRCHDERIGFVSSRVAVTSRSRIPVSSLVDHRRRTVYVKCKAKKGAIRVYGSETFDSFLCDLHLQSDNIITTADVSLGWIRLVGEVMPFSRLQ
ncbi:hypothetical protein AVEN_201326-1 [Araneus ventricosus]|uniref:Uncharacterized protein n=1 Tax=Araneus ventricosus TaxID=182803 RepID=A0A4Y2V051_ARAVE|nr:hypothetical protein AVEN_201326-1 [Araneus ventricosus]